MQIKFENNSVSGIYREYSGFTLKVPGHAIGNKAVVVNVPDNLVFDITRFLSAKHPAVVVTQIKQVKEVIAEPVVPVAVPEQEDTTENSESPVESVQAEETTQAEATTATQYQKHNSRKGGK